MTQSCDRVAIFRIRHRCGRRKTERVTMLFCSTAKLLKPNRLLAAWLETMPTSQLYMDFDFKLLGYRATIIRRNAL